MPGTIELLERSLRPGGTLLIGEPYWRTTPPDPEVVERVLADQDSWDRYTAAQWRNIKTFLDARPDDELAPAFREELDREPLAYTTYRREHLGWGVFALMRR